MKIKSIISTRGIYSEPFWQIVWEWEDILAKELDIKINSISNNIVYRCSNSIFNPSNYSNSKKFIFEINPYYRMSHFPLNCCTKGIIPCVIDYFLPEISLNKFVKSLKNASPILISSAQAYTYLKKRVPYLKFEYFPLSLPDQYTFSPNMYRKKIYDIILIGRPDPILDGYLTRYEKERDNLKIVKRVIKNGSFLYYDNANNLIGNISDRTSYFNLIKKSKVFFYSTPGSSQEKETYGFNPVTPRFLEGLSAGAHPILRYTPNDNSSLKNYS